MRLSMLCAVLLFCLNSMVYASHALYTKADVVACNYMDLHCYARDILPYEQIPPVESSQKEQDEDIRDWAPVSGSVTGHDSVIEVRFTLDQDAIDTLRWRYSEWQPFGLEIDVMDTGKVLEFIDSHNQSSVQFIGFPDDSYPMVDTQDLSRGNSSGALIRDASKLEKDVEYLIQFKLSKPLPDATRVSIAPSFQISYNVNRDDEPQDAGPWDFYALQGEVYPTDWYITNEGRSGFRWSGKGPDDGKAAYDFLKLPDGETKNSPTDFANMGRYDRLDQICRQTNSNPYVEQFRNMTTGRITIYRTPVDQTGYRYSNADCGIEGFSLPASDDGDGSGSGDTSGLEHSEKPNLRAIDTFVTDGESSGSNRISESDQNFLGKSLWCQMRMENTSGKDINDNFYSECYLSVGKKFDGWGDAISLDAKYPSRTKGLDGHDTNTEHQGIDILFYPGWYNVVSKIDVNDDIDETDEKDNSFDKDHPFVFQIWGRPNIVANVWTDKQSYALEEGVSVTASFDNIGSNPYGKTGYVDLYVDGAIVGGENRILREDLHLQTYGKIVTATVSLPQQYGTHEVKACFRFNKEDLVEEADPANNCAVTSVNLPDPNEPVIIVAPVPLEPRLDPDVPGSVLWQGKNPQSALDLSCGPVPPDPNFSKLPVVQAGDIGAAVVGKHRQRIFVPPENVPYIGSGFAGKPMLDIADIAQWCWSSDQTGWGIDNSSACGELKPRADGWWVADIPKTPRASKGVWTIGYRTDTGVSEYWSDVGLWTHVKPDVDGHLRYGGWKRNRMLLTKDASGYLTLTAKFGTFGVPGFWLPQDETLTKQVFWHTMSDQDAGIPGTVRCDRKTGKMVARVDGVTPGSTGTLILGTSGSYVYGWQSSDWVLPAGVSFVSEGKYTLPLDGVAKSFGIDMTYDAGAERLVMTLSSKKMIARAFWTAGFLDRLTDKIVFHVWIGSSGRFIAGTVTEASDGTVSVAFEGVKSGDGGALYTVETDGKKSWQNVGNFSFGNGIRLDSDDSGNKWFVIP